MQEGIHFPVLLATDGDKEKYAGEFRLLRWADLCLTIRSLVVGLLHQEDAVLAAMTLSFLGAVEQNLLGFSVVAVDNFRHGRLSTFNPNVVFHLKRWLALEDTE
jgi:hypothetical protein